MILYVFVFYKNAGIKEAHCVRNIPKNVEWKQKPTSAGKGINPAFTITIRFFDGLPKQMFFLSKFDE